MQLVYAACCPSRPGLKDAVSVRLPTPAILKPQSFYTGKQACTSLAHLISTCLTYTAQYGFDVECGVRRPCMGVLLGEG